MTNDVRVLAAALLWLRNHYECDARDDLEFRLAVMKRADAVIDKYNVDIKDLEKFRLAYPTPNYWKRRHAG